MLKSLVIIGEQVRAARAFLSLSQEELAEAAGVTRKSLYRFEHGSAVERSTELAVRRALEKRGIIFVHEGGRTGVLGTP